MHPGRYRRNIIRKHEQYRMNSLIAILPIFIIILAGYSLRALHVVKPSWVSALNGFVFYVALPALIVLSFSSINLFDPAISKLLMANFALIGLAAILLAGILKLSKLSSKLQATIFLVVLVGNTVYLGIPVITATLPAATPELTAAISAIQLVAAMIIALLAIEWLFLGSRDYLRISGSLSKNPLLISLGIGILMSFISLPTSIDHLLTPALKLLAATASPLALFTLGAFLHGHGRPKRWGTLLLSSTGKLIFLPVLAWLFLPQLGLPTDASLQASILLAAMPTAVTAFVLTESYHLDRDLAATTMVITTALSAVSVPVIISLITH